MILQGPKLIYWEQSGNRTASIFLQLQSWLIGPDQPRGPPSGDSADREAYRRGPAPGMEPKGGAGSDFKPEFVSVSLKLKA